MSQIEATQLPDGSVLVTGLLTGVITATGRPNFLARYTPAGQRDPSFGTGGVNYFAPQFVDLTPMPDGTVLALQSSATSRQVVSRTTRSCGVLRCTQVGVKDSTPALSSSWRPPGYLATLHRLGSRHGMTWRVGGLSQPLREL